jgi:1-phosphofructokinase
LAVPEQESGRVAIFAPNLLLTIALEARGEGRDDIHLHAGGQGVWVARMAAELGADPVLCGLIGGESGAVLEPLLGRLPGERRLIGTEAASGAHVIDRRGGERVLVSRAAPEAPSRHRIDDLVSLACATGLDSATLVITNPDPPAAWPLEVYGNLAADVGANGTPVLVDLSSPRLDSALEGKPYLVKINDWELAEFVCGPVDGPERLLAAAGRLREQGAANVIVTRGGEPALVLHGDSPSWLVPPRFDRGAREGCGDTMMGALAAGLALGRPWEAALLTAAAAGAVNFLRHGLGTGRREVVEEVAAKVELRPFDQSPS